MKLSAMMGRQLPLLSFLLPTYALTFYAGMLLHLFRNGKPFITINYQVSERASLNVGQLVL
jgi:hypothetical protein